MPIRTTAISLIHSQQFKICFDEKKMIYKFRNYIFYKQVSALCFSLLPAICIGLRLNDVHVCIL